MNYSTSGRHRQGHKSTQRQQLRLENMVTGEVTGEEIIEEQIELQIDGVNRDCHSPSVSFHHTVETQTVSSSSSSSPSNYSSVSSHSNPFSSNTLSMRYSRRRRRAASPQTASRAHNTSHTQQSVLIQEFLSSQTSIIAPSLSPSTSFSPASSSVELSSRSLDSCSSSPPLLPRPVPGAGGTMLAVSGPSQHVTAFRGRKRHTAAGNICPVKGSREVSQQPASQFIPWWKHWESVAVNLNNVPLEANTFTIWNAFRKEGNIFSIDLFEDEHGNKEGRGKVRFKPAPNVDFWRNNTYKIVLPGSNKVSIFVNLDLKHQVCRIPSPAQPNISFPAEVKLPITSLDIGILTSETTMLPLRTVGDGHDEQAYLALDLKRRTLFVYFQLSIFNPKEKSAKGTGSQHEYRLKIPFSQMTRIFQNRDSKSGCISQFTFLDSPPLYHRRIKNIEPTFVDETTWRDTGTWFRQTQVVHNPQGQASLPASLRKLNPIIDIGRWNAFKITYPKTANGTGKLSLVCDILKDFNITFEETDGFVQSDTGGQSVRPVWEWIDLFDARPSQDTSSSLHDLFDETYVSLPFSVRYQLEVCISHGYLSEFTMPREFATKLFDLGEANATKLLEHVASKKHVFYDPMKIFNIKFVKGVTNAKIPSYCCYMRSATITPSTVYYSTPSVDISNRVIRHFIEYSDRFLRVRFTDEKLLGRINSTSDNTMDEVFTRIKRTLANGIVIGDRHYEFLAFGNSQFREHGAYFFAPLSGVTAANIRSWMGHFNNIKNVAKYAARLGQCFSTTRAVAGCPVQVRKINDVVRNGYTFSDGVGRISRFLAQMATSELKIKTLSGDVPSAFQFRLGGSKGMLTVSSQAQRQEVHIRDSQDKFSAFHNGLEIIRWSQFSLATLNRQLITVLSTLGVPDKIFHDKLRIMLKNLNEAMTNDSQAIYLLKKYVDPNQMTLVVSQIVADGFRKSGEPFLTSIMRLWRAWHLKYLKEKAKIAVDRGASLLGCMDETGILKGHFQKSVPSKEAPYDDKLAALPEIFVQVSRPDNSEKYEIIEGVCILARNPSLHPGDIRVVKAVSIPELSHLRDVVVLPQTGDRDIPSMCSGGDLDGDDYLVIWDQSLIPGNWFREPMDYATNKAHDLDHDVTVDEITSFFVTYIKNDCLPRIAHAHLAWADYLENGVEEEKCIRLSQLHSDAVDYNKTGNAANMTRNLQPRKWPHFMEKNHKSKEQIYHSKKILGQLYDTVERVDFVPSLEMPFDRRILDCSLEVTEDLLQFAKSLKIDYDTSMRRIMAQHEIKTEFEVWSTFVLSHANTSKDYKFHEELGAISNSLKEHFRELCYEYVGGRSFQLIAPLAVAMYRITEAEMSAALNKHLEETPSDGKLFHRPTPRMDQLPLISFPWTLSHVLGKIALGHYEEPDRPVAIAENQKKFEIKQTATSENQHNTDVTYNIPTKGSGISDDEFNITAKSQQDDLFGAFADYSHLFDRPSSSLGKGELTDRNEEIESLEELVGFGFSRKPVISGIPLLSTGQSLSDLDLMEFEESQRPSSDIAASTSTASSKRSWTSPFSSPSSPSPSANYYAQDSNTSKTENPEAPGNTGKDDFLEIVEDGSLEPNAVDKLNELLGY